VKVTADDIARLLASAPPRQVPGDFLHAGQGGGRGWGLPLFGMVFGTFGMFFVWIFFPTQLADDWRLDESEQTTSGIVRSATDTNMSINDEQVVEYVFAYLFSGNDAHTASCYTTGRRWQEGDQVTVRYLADQPAIARIEGGRLSKGGGLVGALVMIFPLIGYGLVAWFLVAKRRMRQLLENGRVAEVDVLAVDATRVRVNYQTVYKITLSPLPETSGEPVTIKRWANPEINLLTSHALQKQPIFVLYDPRWPRQLIFPEALIGN
jgi:hypothetical protein